MELKTKNILEVYQIVSEAKLTKVSDSNKIKIVRMLFKMKPINEDYQDFIKDAQEKLKGENHDEILAKAQQWQKEGENTALTENERIEVNKYLFAYQQKIEECAREEIEKVHSLEYERIGDEGLETLLGSNPDWTPSVIMKISNFV